MVELTEYEAEVVVDFIEMSLVESIKTDGADSLQWIHPECSIEIFVDDIDGYKFCPNCGRRRRNDV